MTIPYIRVRFELRAREDIHFAAFAGVTLRGGFGIAMKRSLCINPAVSCASCVVAASCAYRLLFETPVPSDSELLIKYPFSPHPFILHPALQARIREGETFSFDATLIGSGIHYLPHVILAVERLGHNGLGRTRGTFSIESVSAGEQIYAGSGTAAMPEALHAAIPDPEHAGGSCTFTVRYATPMHIISGGTMLRDISLKPLILAALRRLSLLSYFFCSTELPAYPLVEDAAAEHSSLVLASISRRSTRTGEGMTLLGITGEQRFVNIPMLWYNVLSAAAAFNVGKKTSFGFGNIAVSRE